MFWQIVNSLVDFKFINDYSSSKHKSEEKIIMTVMSYSGYEWHVATQVLAFSRAEWDRQC